MAATTHIDPVVSTVTGNTLGYTVVRGDQGWGRMNLTDQLGWVPAPFAACFETEAEAHRAMAQAQ